MEGRPELFRKTAVDLRVFRSEAEEESVICGASRLRGFLQALTSKSEVATIEWTFEEDWRDLGSRTVTRRGCGQTAPRFCGI
jgi:hypothetical protein